MTEATPTPAAMKSTRQMLERLQHFSYYQPDGNGGITIYLRHDPAHDRIEISPDGTAQLKRFSDGELVSSTVIAIS